MEASVAPPPVTAPVGAIGHAADLIDLLLTIGYVDGVFHHRELTYVHNYIDTVLMLAEELSEGNSEQRARIRTAYQAQFRTLQAQLELELARLAQELEVTPEGTYIAPRLTQRAVGILRKLPVPEQGPALELALAMMHADGAVTAAERRLYDELSRAATPVPTAAPPKPIFAGSGAIFGAATAVQPAPAAAAAAPAAAAPAAAAAAAPAAAAPAVRKMVVLEPHWNPLKATGHALIDPLEQTYSPHPLELKSQLDFDYQLIGAALERWARLRAGGQGRLAGVTDIDRIPVGSQFLDGHVHVMRPARPTELVVIGDLHGCYACLKAALMQSDFINRVWAHQWDPATYPDVKLVLLGDYVDRGYYSFDGVMRTVLQLFCAMPDHVFVLRGNHECYKSREGRVFSAVHPAEGLYSIVRHAPIQLLEAYKTLFDQLPTSMLFDRTFFVHGGIPREDTLAARWRDLSSLDDPELRFQMLWSDPVNTVDSVHVELQKKSSRFTFGKKQFAAFMEKIGCHTMIRGHEQIDAGFEVIFDLGDKQLLNLFSAGGHDNRDLPADSSYRKVRPMALTVVQDHAGLRAIPWPIEYQRFNYEVHNGLYRPQRKLEHEYT